MAMVTLRRNMATAFEFDITTGWPLAAMSGGHASLHAQCPASHRGAGCVQPAAAWVWCVTHWHPSIGFSSLICQFQSLSY
jgi:hypothetical protein